MMNNKMIFISLISLSSVGATIAMAQFTNTPVPEKENSIFTTHERTTETSTTTTDHKDVDNSAINKRDARGDTMTPEKQASGSTSDVEVTRKIRKLITSDKSLSTTAKNVKIVTQNGNVTLRGVVKSVEESDKIQKAAKQVAGAGAVTNELDVKQK